MNASPTESYPVELTFEELNLTRANGRVLSAERLDAHNSFNKPATVQPRPIETLKTVGNTIQFTLPPASVSAVLLAKSHGQISKAIRIQPSLPHLEYCVLCTEMEGFFIVRGALRQHRI